MDIDSNAVGQLQRIAISKVVSEFLSVGTHDAQVESLLTKLVLPVLNISQTDRALLSSQNFEDLERIKKLLELYKAPSADDDVERFIVEVKSVSSGPMFHLRVSKVGVNMLAKVVEPWLPQKDR